MKKYLCGKKKVYQSNAKNQKRRHELVDMYQDCQGVLTKDLKTEIMPAINDRVKNVSHLTPLFERNGITNVEDLLLADHRTVLKHRKEDRISGHIDWYKALLSQFMDEAGFKFLNDRQEHEYVKISPKIKNLDFTV